MGAVDYVPVPVVPEVLRAKVRVFAELYRKTRQLEQLNAELEQRVAERTAELEASACAAASQSEQRRSLALAAGQMGSWDWDLANGDCMWDEGQHRIFGVEPGRFQVTVENIRALIHPDDWARILESGRRMARGRSARTRPSSASSARRQVRWCTGAAASARRRRAGRARQRRDVDITDRKEAGGRQALLAREVDHRARNALAVTQSIIHLYPRQQYEGSLYCGRERTHRRAVACTCLAVGVAWQGADLAKLVDDELAPYRISEWCSKHWGLRRSYHETGDRPNTCAGAARIGDQCRSKLWRAFFGKSGSVDVSWELNSGNLTLEWIETGGPATKAPSSRGFGTKLITSTCETNSAAGRNSVG